MNEETKMNKYMTYIKEELMMTKETSMIMTTMTETIKILKPRITVMTIHGIPKRPHTS